MISNEAMPDSLFIIQDTLPVYLIPVVDSNIIHKILSSDHRFVQVGDQVMEFYKQQQYRCGWFNQYGLTEQTGKVVNLITGYFESGVLDTTLLVPATMDAYHLVSNPDFTPAGNDSLVLETDILFTAQFFLLATKAWKGIGPEKAKTLEWFVPVKQVSLTSYLKLILSGRDEFIHKPVPEQYVKLIEKLRQYNKIKSAGGWGIIQEPDNALVKGESSPVIAQLRKRLFITGDFTNDTTSTLFDDSLATAVALSRRCFGLTDTALIDHKLIHELNVGINERIRQLLVNLERWKWIPPQPDSLFIVVNIPEFMLHVFRNETRIKSMRVVTGKAATQTVIFSDAISTIVFSPYWTIPRGILTRETLPAIKKSTDYLTSKNMEVVTNTNPPRVIDPSTITWENYSGSNFPYSIRQKPGPTNSMGYVKFLFPNSYDIYLHDTPHRELFSRTQRMFSNGCIRIEDPQWLAGFLLTGDSAWNENRIEEAMTGGRETYVSLKTKVPVYITYFTCWTDDNGSLHFRKDIYGHDQKLEGELFRGVAN